MTADPNLQSLVERLRAATETSRLLEAQIYEATGIDEEYCARWCRMDGRTDLTRARFIRACAPHFTASLDAAVALAERVLPGWCWEVGLGPRPKAWAYVYPDMKTAGYSNEAKTPALALCIAILTALIAKESPNA